MKLDKYHYHELLDRSSVITDMFDKYIQQHAVVEQNRELQKLCDSAEYALSEIYQKAGELAFKDEIKKLQKKNKKISKKGK